MVDKYGWNKQKVYNGTHKGHCNFYRNTTNPDIKIWIKKAENTEGYLVEKSTHLGNCKFENKVITQFKTAVEAKKWVNTEYQHILKPAE